MIQITLSDGSTYSGWRAIPWFLLFSPFIAVWLAFGAFLYTVRWITGRDRVLGYEYDHGTWRKVHN